MELVGVDQVISRIIAEKQQIFRMLQQQFPQAHPCLECDRKQAMLQKFTELVHLLRKKNQRQDESRTKSSIQSQLNWVQTNSTHLQGAARFLVVAEKASFREVLSSFKLLQARGRHLALPFIEGLAIIKQSQEKQPSLQAQQASTVISTLKHSPNSNGQVNPKTSSEFRTDLLEEFKFKNSPKFLLKKIFELNHEKEALGLKLQKIEKDLQENIRRQEREIAKKRQSLQGLADELSQKNEVIDELKESIKSLQNKLGVRDNVVLHKMLEQDVQSLRHTIFKLQNTNQKLNNELVKVRGEKANLQKENKELMKIIEKYKGEIVQLKESMFEIEQEAQQNWFAKRELEIVGQKITAKLEKLKKMEKKYNQISRGKDSMSTHPDQLTIYKSERKVQTTANSLQKNEQEKSSELETKLEAVFSFLFNLESQDYQLHAAELFDEEEKELLLTHQHKFIASRRASHLKPIDFPSKRCIESHMDAISIADSLLEAFQDKPVEVPPQNSKQNMKLIEFELERNKFIEKISQVKEKQLHLRCIILQLLKTLDLRTVKKDTEGIVTLLCDLFEYSEQERATIAQSKSKKFFGLI